MGLEKSDDQHSNDAGPDVRCVFVREMLGNYKAGG